MSGINKVILVGHVGKDPTFKVLDDVAILTFPLATSDTFNRDGQKIEQTEWHNIIMWRGLAEAGYRVLKKNRLVYIEGKIRTRSFTDRDGIKKYATEIISEQFTLLGRTSDFAEDVDIEHFNPNQF